MIEETLVGRARDAVGKFDFERAVTQFGAWLLQVVAHEPPPKATAALNFGLFETERGCQLYVMGANRYDPTDSGWALANDWWPEGRYAPLDSLSTLWHEVENEEVPAWLVVQAVVLSIVKAFFARQSSDFHSASGLRSVTVTSGFDDGDLFTVVTPLTPAA